MTANTKMTEDNVRDFLRYRQECIDALRLGGAGPKNCLCAECDRKKYWLEGLQAGRAEMAKKITPILKEHINEDVPCVSCAKEILREIKIIAQRDGGANK